MTHFAHQVYLRNCGEMSSLSREAAVNSDAGDAQDFGRAERALCLHGAYPQHVGYREPGVPGRERRGWECDSPGSGPRESGAGHRAGPGGGSRRTLGAPAPGPASWAPASPCTHPAPRMGRPVPRGLSAVRRGHPYLEEPPCSLAGVDA